MNPIQTTPVPNILFDVYLKDLKGCELKILLVIIRQTLGWVDKQSGRGRKSRDWISTSQLKRKTGVSRRAISSALAGLIKNRLIKITDNKGYLLSQSMERKGKIRLYYQLAISEHSTVDNMGKSSLQPISIESTNAEIAQHISKKVHALAQKMHITKETLQN